MSVTCRPTAPLFTLLPGVRWALGGLAVLAPISVPEAHAELQDTVTLSWQAPEECPDGQFVLARVSEIVDEQSPREVPVHVAARIERVATGFRLWLEMTEGTSRWHQQLEDPSCAQLAEAASVVIALAAGHERNEAAVQLEQPAATDSASDSSQASGSAEPDTAAESVAEPVLPAWGPSMRPLARRTWTLGSSQAAPVHPKKLPSSSHRQSRPQPGSPRPTAGKPNPTPGRESGLLLQAGVVGDLGTLPEPAAGLLIGAGVEGHEGRSIILSGAFLPETRGTSDDVSGVGGEFRLRTAIVAGCQATVGTPASLQFCVGAELGQFRARGILGDWTETRRHLWLAPRADAGGQLRLGRASAVASVGAVVPLVRKEYVMDNAGGIHQPSWLAGRLTVAARYRF